MNQLAARIAHRYLHADAFINLNPMTLVMADGGVVSATDLKRVLGLHDIEAHDVVIYRHREDDPSTFRWAGRGGDQEHVRGQLVLHVDHDNKHVVVTAEIALATRYVASQGNQEHAATTEPMLPVKQRLQLISSIARRAIQDLRGDPKNVKAVLMHLSDIVEISEQPGWALEP